MPQPLEQGAVEDAVQALVAGGLTYELSVALAVLRGAAAAGAHRTPPSDEPHPLG